jgi:hypothetical protein
MSRTGKIIVALVVVAVVAGGVLVVMNKRATRTGAHKVDQSGEQNADNTSRDTTKQADVTITYDGQGFTLSSASVKSGGTVTISNSSDRDLRFQSDPHPIHTDNAELNVGEVAPGKSVTITLTNKGTWGFHNHLNHGQTGSITVE